VTKKGFIVSAKMNHRGKTSTLTGEEGMTFSRESQESTSYYSVAQGFNRFGRRCDEESCGGRNMQSDPSWQKGSHPRKVRDRGDPDTTGESGARD